MIDVVLVKEKRDTIENKKERILVRDFYQKNLKPDEKDAIIVSFSMRRRRMQRNKD